MPYCRICGTKLEENALFCHKCGTPAAFLSSAPSPARPMEKSPFLVPVIILIAVVVVAVIVGVFIFWTFYSVNFNQSNGSNQTNVNELSFNFQGDIAKANVIAQNLIGKTVLITTSATGLHRTNHQPVPA
ncbi:MAG TPA: zinc ribbon domain-containing protein [Candidatus Bathyarchaeia archaeon]|nr:zinc ribbon domain-containing protein [Candidatus Bathyarchaeia archaeon]